MVEVERVDDATEVVTDPRFGPPEPSHLGTSGWALFFLSLGLLLLVPSPSRKRNVR